MLLVDNFVTDGETGVTAYLGRSYANTGKSQPSVINSDQINFAKNGVVAPDGLSTRIAGLVERPSVSKSSSNVPSIKLYVLRPDICRGLSAGSGDKMKLDDTINILRNWVSRNCSV